MIVPEEQYGWGILTLRVCRIDSNHAGQSGIGPPVHCRHLADLISWRGFFGSCLATLIAMASLLLYGQMAPLAPPPPPVEVSYRLQPDITAIPQPKPPVVPPSAARPAEVAKPSPAKLPKAGASLPGPPPPPVAAPPTSAAPAPAATSPAAEPRSFDLPPQAEIALPLPPQQLTLRPATPAAVLNVQPAS